MSEQNKLPWCALVSETNEGGVTVNDMTVLSMGGISIPDHHIEAWTEEGLLYLEHNSDLTVIVVDFSVCDT